MGKRLTASGSFTVATIEDGVSVEAQYSPDKSTIHSVWQDGDIYMRTRESDSSVWSSWHLIVGENGGETDFSFAISSQKTTESASTSPSDIGTDDWADAPVAITSAKPYLWARVQQKSWNASTQDYVVDSTRYIRLTGENGVSITSADVVFGLSTSETTAPSPDNTTTWKTSIAALSLTSSDKNKYIWQCTKITYSNGNTVYTGKMCLGVVSSFADIIEQYAIGTALAATGTWQDTTPPSMANGYYLWTRTKLVYSDNSVSYAPSSNGYCVGYYGVDGTSITGANVWYALSTSNSSAPQDSAFTLDDFPTTLNAGYYVWEATKITFSSGSPIFTGKMCLGATSDFLSGTEVYAISTSNSTAPDDNQFGTTYSKTKGYYLWTATRVQYTNSNYAYLNKKCVGYWGEDGTSPVFADLNNEMDAIQCKHDGSVIADQTVSTVISMWKGSAVEVFVIDNIYRNGTQLTWDGNNNGVWPRVSGSTVLLEFTTSASIADVDDFKITIHSYNDNTVTRELHFTINGVRANAIYRLVPSHSQIVKKKDGTYVPSGNVTCSVEKTENGSTSTPSSSEYTLEKSVNGGSYTTYSTTAASSITSDLKFRLTVGGVVVDLETIPLVSDGNKGDTGDSAPAAFASPAQISIPCYSNGNVKAQKTTSVSFNLKVGAENATVTGITSDYAPTGVSVQVVYTNAATITVGTSATASGLSAGVTFTVTGTYDGKTYSATVTVALIGSTQGEQGDPGDTGARGKIGRFYYYAQEWSNDPSVSYAVTDAEAPFFFYKNPTTGAENYWVFNPAENDTYTMQDMGEPSSADENWIIMHTEFKFIITEAIFSNYAHLGSAIISGDYLISQYGYMLGFCNTRTPIDDKTQYQNVDTDDILGEENMYKPEKLIWDDSNEREITSTTYTTISSASFVQNRYYAFEIDEKSQLSGNELLWTIVSQSGTVIANGTIASTATGESQNCVIFKSTISAPCFLRVKITNESESTYFVISRICLRFAKFIPYLAMDLLAGKIVANNIIARGELHADSLYYTMVYGHSNEDRIPINDESIINLGTTAADTTVILPSPTVCKGRVVELFNHATGVHVTWVGASTSSAFSAAYGTTLGIPVKDEISYKYIKFYCNGADWWILKAEG